MESSSALAELAFEQSQRRLDKQERVLEELRARTAILLAASSLAASFLGKEAFGGSGWGVLAVVAAVAFLVTILSAVYVLLPRMGSQQRKCIAACRTTSTAFGRRTISRSPDSAKGYRSRPLASSSRCSLWSAWSRIQLLELWRA